jgi:beta-lactam-binding protein with PASTA domain
MDLRTLVAVMASSSGIAGEDPAALPFISLKEPLMYEFSAESAGTILQQRPEPGTPISGPTVLEFVVSRGPEHTMIVVPNLAGLSVAEVVDQIRQSGINFSFELRPVRGGEKPGISVFQDPEAQASIDKKKPVSILVTAPPDGIQGGELFALFKYQLPENPYPLPVRLEALLPSGERQTLAEVEYPGGEFTLPYQLPPQSTLILSMLNRELYREEVQPPMDTLSLDQL